MKARLSLFLVLILTLTALTASAETELKWSDAESAASAAGGSFVTLDKIALKFWIPRSFSSVQPDESETESGIISSFISADEASGVYVQYIEGNGLGLEEYAEVLEDQGYTFIKNMRINGHNALSFNDTENEAVFIAFATEAGMILQFIFLPDTDEDFMELASIIAASIQPEE